MADAENKKQKTAIEAYQTAKDDIANLIGFLECELTKQRDTINWATAGSMRHVRKNLIETLAFISGLDENQIEESLEDMRDEEANS